MNETPLNQLDRSLELRLQEYREREREIQRLESRLVQLQKDHKMQTEFDFGIADGDVFSVGSLAELILKLKNSNKGE